MVSALTRWGILTISVWVASSVIPGVTCDRWQSLLLASLVLGLLNVFVKPFILLFTLPAVVITLGLFLVVINAGLLLITSRLVPSLQIAGFWSAVGASIIISLVSLFFGAFRQRRGQRRPSNGGIHRISRPPPGEGPVIDV